MNIQIFGTKKSFETQKAERYFKERKIRYQYIDLNEKGLSKGELDNVLLSVNLSDIINRSCKEYTALNLDKIRTNSVREDILLNNAKLYNTPIVRNGKQATVGYKPEVWANWV